MRTVGENAHKKVMACFVLNENPIVCVTDENKTKIPVWAKLVSF